FIECSFYGALYNKSCDRSKGGFVDKFVRDPNKTPDSSQRPPHDCLKCENPVDGLHCRQCALLRKKLKEVSPPHIEHHCHYGCGDSLDGIFCQRCTCESCGNGAQYGYNCPPKVLIISNPEPCHNQNVDEFPQTLPSFHPTCYSGDENSFAYDSTPNFVNDSPNVFNPPPQPLTYSYEFYRNDTHYSQDCPPQVSFIYSSIISSSKIDSLLDEFAGDLIFLKSIPPGFDEADCDPEEEIHLIEKLLYDNSSPRPPEEFNSENSDAVIESFSPSPIPVEDSDSFMKEIDLSLTLDDLMPLGIENDDYDSEGEILFLGELFSNDSPHFLKMSHFILIFHHPLVLLRNHRMMMEFTLMMSPL
nr:hypothetical protein [Tanacetum cinerariifolium]